MAGISSKAAGKLKSNKGFNGNEIQNKEFSDGSGLEVYDFNARTYDPQTGRFIQIDPLIESGDQERLTPYQFSYNNPVRFNDPDSKCPLCIPLIPYVSEALYAGGVAVVAYFTAKAAAPILLKASENLGKSIQTTDAPFTANANAYTPLSAQVAQARLNTEAKKFDGQNSTENSSSKEALRSAKDQNGVPRSQQPDNTIKPNTPAGDKAGLDNRNVKQYEYTNSNGEKVVIRQDNPATYPDGGSQPPHFNAGKAPEVPKDLDQHHNYNFNFTKIY